MSKVGKIAVILFLISLFFLFCGCRESEPRPTPKFKMGQKVIHKATQLEYYIIDPTESYNSKTGWVCYAFTYDITQEKIDEWKKIFSDVNKQICIDGGKLTWKEKMYESLLEPVEDEYSRY